MWGFLLANSRDTTFFHSGHTDGLHLLLEGVGFPLGRVPHRQPYARQRQRHYQREPHNQSELQAEQ